MTPHKKVSPEKYKQTAKIKWRIKGNVDGHIYQGQEIVQACKTCFGRLTAKQNDANIHL